MRQQTENSSIHRIVGGSGVASALAFFVFANVVLSEQVVAQPKWYGTVDTVNGDLEMLSAAFPEKGWRRVNSGQDLYKGDKLRTGDSKDTFVSIRLVDETGSSSSLIMGPDSNVELDVPSKPEKSALDTAEEVWIELRDGVMRWITGESRPQRMFNIRTPTAVAGVSISASRRAPDVYPEDMWMFTNSNKTEFMANKGEFRIQSRDSGIGTVIAAGQKVAVSEDGMGNIHPFTKAEWDEAVASTPLPTAGGCDDASGSWTQSNRTGSSTWVLTRKSDGSYAAEESGLGQAKGTATLSGKSLTINFSTGGTNPYVGVYTLTLDADCKKGSGKVRHVQGPLKGREYDCTITRGG